MVRFSWNCPYCSHASIITDSNFSSGFHYFDHGNKEKGLCIITKVTVCPNFACKEFAVDALLYKTETSYDAIGRPLHKAVGNPLTQWQLKPQSSAKPFPTYIPTPIITDYEEASLIKSLSPKASATLSRRCLQGIIRDFWGISKSRLVDEINELKGKIDIATWEAIDAVRSIGNIGAHMEKDINIIIDVEPEEAELLIGLIEVLLKDWYIARYERQQHLQNIVNIASAKNSVKSQGSRS